MKVYAKRVEATNKKGKKKDSGQPYHIDNAQIVCDVPFEQSKDVDDDFYVGFGVKEMTYQVGLDATHENFDKYKLEQLRGKLPCELELELGQGVNQWGNTQTVVTGIKLPSAVKPVNA